MAIFRLPTSTTVSYYEFEVDLDGVEFVLEFRFNNRDDSWYMTISDTDGNILRAGLRIVRSALLLRLWAETTRPEGEIAANDQGEVSAPPTLNQLGAEVVLSYLDAAELAAIG